MFDRLKKALRRIPFSELPSQFKNLGSRPVPLAFILIGASGLGILFSGWWSSVRGGVTIKSYGHSALLIKGGGQSVLINPFKAVACAKGLVEPRITANVILASSELADEGAKVAKGKFLAQPGSYRVGLLKLEGLAFPHDRLGGRRFCQATVWRWKQAGLTFAHLGGTAAPLTDEIKVLLARSDVLIIGVGGGPKVFNAQEAARVVEELKPRRVIPVQFLRSEKALKNCQLEKGLKPFIEAMKGAKVQEVGNTYRVPRSLSSETTIDVIRL